MSSANLPVELWRQIIEVASGEDVPLHTSLISSTASSRRWRKDEKSNWSLEDVEEERRRRHSTRMKKRKVRIH